MSARASHFRPIEVEPLTREPPFTTDARVHELVAPVLGNRLAALAPAEATKLRMSFNVRHNELYATQVAHARHQATREIEEGNRLAVAARRYRLQTKRRRERELAAARRSKDRFAIFYAELAVQEIESVLDAADRNYIPLSYIEPDWLGGLLDEIEAALRVTNLGSKMLASRSKTSVVVLIAEAVIPDISGWTISADAISQAAYRQQRKGSA